MPTIAVVPERIRRRWDAIARVQLIEAAHRLAEENEQLAGRVRFAEESADMWQQISDIERDRGSVGLTIDGYVVRLDASTGATIDDDPEYR